MASNEENGKGQVDIDLVYSQQSNLKKAIADAQELLKQRGYIVRSCAEDSNLQKDARFRVYFFNKAFKNHQLPRYEAMLFDKAITTPDNSLVLVRSAHTKYLPEELSEMRLSVPILIEMNGQEATNKILTFLSDREAQGRVADINAFDRQFEKMKQATDDFDFGRAFVLISNIRRPVDKRSEALAMFPWLKVFDMSDKTKRPDGFLSVVRPRLVPGKFNETTVTEPPSKPESDYTCWTVWEDKANAASLFAYANLLQEYCCGLRVPTVVILWYPKTDELDYDLCDLVTRLTHPFEGGTGASCILVTEKVPPERSLLDKLLPKDVRESNRVVVPLQTFLEWFSLEMRNRAYTKVRSNLLPVRSPDMDQPAAVPLTERDLNQLNYGMRVLTFDEKEDRAQHLCSEETSINFLQGDLISWETIADGTFDAVRELSSKIVHYIEKEHLKEGISGQVNIHHHPGSGGTTLGRRILWQLRKKVPCLAVNEGAENLDNLREKIAFLRNLTYLPTILLMDGPMEAEKILKVMPNERVIILHVARYYGSMDNKKNKDGDFYLKETVSQNDSSSILPIYEKFGKHSCKKLENTLLGGGVTYMYEYGLTAFTDNFRGIREYVKGHLIEKVGEKKWKDVIELLALAKHYGHKTLPRQIFRKMLEKLPNGVVKKQDIGYLGRQLIQGDGDHWSIRYVEVAREVLKQSLMKDTLLGPVGGQMLELTGNSCDNLKNLVIKLIDTLHGCIEKPNDIPSRILDILKDVFIIRHEIGDEMDRFKKYSMLLADVDSDEHREEIFKKLVDCFPKHADFHAHLGRFYSHVKRFEEAESALNEALKTRQQELTSYRYRHQEGDDTLQRIYHMLGTSYFEKMQSSALDHTEGDVVEILDYANKAIEQFEQARKYFTVASNLTYGFLGEAKVRLEVVALAKERGLLKRHNSNTEIEDFSARSFGISDRLLAQCAERADDADLKRSEFGVLIKRILEIYGDLTPLLDNFTRKSAGISSSMCKIASLRNKYTTRGQRFPAFSDIDSKDLIRMVSLLEELVKDSSARTSKRRISTEMLEWLRLVRRLNEPPPLEEIRKMVKMWDDCKERHSLSTFYLYVIYVAMALNYGGKRMNEIFRKEVESLREKLRNYETTISRYQQYKSLEFLGISSKTTFDCLTNREQLEPEFYKNHQKNQKRFRRCIGTVREIKNWFGILHLDGPPEYPIEIFCAANRYNLTRQHAKEKVRVTFYLQFNPRHGAEAFDIAELQKCYTCLNEVEVRHYDASTDEATDGRNLCPKCRTVCY